MGNILYFALHAHAQQSAGRDVRVVDPDPGNAWAPALPRLGGLMVPPSGLRWSDRRLDIPTGFHQGFGTDFTRAELESFVHDVVLGARTPAGGPLVTRSAADRVVLNVRRGDYYSDPVFRGLFGFDVADYLKRALVVLEDSSGLADKVHVVSDDPEWCRQNLGWLLRDGRSVSWSTGADGVLGNFLDIAGARRLVITNSTFAYWGAYTSNVLHGDNHSLVIAPRLHSRDVDDGKPWQHDPLWLTVAV
ncbi:alpha-1,2-fucosyltransferase [Rhodococcus antarcticus]|uniref:Alpha-1,2-fucosyltransferase n=1 Tax=Rhodococcus antarcticus TaxID=2987751 RepID=A0ABY6NZX6_9NOCA|nr:alpha-1,2-fucosyltransferase [Rhodococcus antarcticus]UZJ24962.1 alpha-1,2-fucosyltransferase [Rhodococcus antarcticus]